MQIPKFLSILCVAAFGLATLHAQRADTEEQAKARELLRQKMAELGAQQPATPTPQPAPAAPKSKPAKPASKKRAARPAPVVAPAPTQPVPTRDSTGVPPPARPAPNAVSAPVVTPPTAVAVPTQPAPSAPARAVNPAPAGSTTRLTPEAEAQAREELRRKMAELGPSGAATSRAVPAPADQAPSKPTAARKKAKNADQDAFATPPPSTPVGSPIPSAVPSSKSQKLSELLTRYRSNAITPEEYHKQRAAILAQP